MNMKLFLLLSTLLCTSIAMNVPADSTNRSVSPLMEAIEHLDVADASALVIENALCALYLEVIQERNLRLTSPLDRAQRLLHNAVADRDSWVYSEHKVGPSPFSSHEVEKREKLRDLITLMNNGLKTLKEELRQQSKTENASYSGDTVRLHNGPVKYLKGSYPDCRFIPITSNQSDRY